MNTRNLKRTFTLTLGITLTAMITIGNSGAAAASRLHAGTARTEITPEAEQAVDLSNRIMQLHDPLYARALVLRSGDTALAIVSLDLILFSSRRVVEEARKRFNLDQVILSSTHTHSAPAAEPMRIKPPLGDWTRRGDPGEEFDWDALAADPWYGRLEETVIETIGAAAADMFPATWAAGRGEFTSVYMAHNRRLAKDGKFVRMMWDNPNLEPTAPIDPSLGVLRIGDTAGNIRALLVHYACHPVGMMGSGMVSRDFPGAMCDHIEQELGGDAMAFFLQGASGDMDPHFMNQQGQHRLNIVRQTGIALGKAALELAGTLGEGSNQVRLRTGKSIVPVGRRNSDKTSNTGLTVIVLDRELALVSIPGEPFIQHQLNLNAAAPLPHAWILGLAYAGAGSPFLVYIPTAEAAAQGGYGARECSFVDPNAGLTLMRAAVEKISALLSGD